VTPQERRFGALVKQVSQSGFRPTPAQETRSPARHRLDGQTSSELREGWAIILTRKPQTPNKIITISSLTANKSNQHAYKVGGSVHSRAPRLPAPICKQTRARTPVGPSGVALCSFINGSMLFFQAIPPSSSPGCLQGVQPASPPALARPPQQASR